MTDEPNLEEEKDFDSKFKQFAKLSAQRWRSRKRMAWICLISVLLVTYWALFIIPVERLEKLDDIITWFYTIMGSVVLGYLGIRTLDDKWKKGK